MDDTELAKSIDALTSKADDATRAAERARKYLFWTGVITIVFIVVPLLGFALVAPQFVDIYKSVVNTKRAGF